MKIGVIGSGQVGETLSDGFLRHEYEVMRGTREPSKLAAWQAKAGKRASVGTFAETARFGDVVVLAVKGAAAEEAVRGAGVDNLAGKVVIDTTNPLADAPPEKGVLLLPVVLRSVVERLVVSRSLDDVSVTPPGRVEGCCASAAEPASTVAMAIAKAERVI